MGVGINIAHKREELFIDGGMGDMVSREDGTRFMRRCVHCELVLQPVADNMANPKHKPLPDAHGIKNCFRSAQ